MELQIGDLISATRKEGDGAAQAEAERIGSEAKKQAAAIVAAAKEEAEHIRSKTQSEVALLKESAKIAAEHARRDAMLSFKAGVRAEFEKILSADLAKTADTATLAKLIAAAIGEEDPSQYAAEVHEVTQGLKGELAKLLRGGLELKVNPDIRAGFRLAAKDGSGYFDCSDEELMQMLLPFFSDFEI